jgi:hypothetical protein
MFVLYFQMFTLIINLLVAATAARFLIEGECRDNREVGLCFAFLIPNLLSVICIFISFFNK